MSIDTPPTVAMRPTVARPPMVKRGAVTMAVDPPEFHWNGTHVALSPIETALLAALLRRSRLRWDDANAVLAEGGCCVDSRDVLIHRIRRKFAGIGAANPIETVRGWGVRFRTEADAQGSSAFWIGAIESNPTLNS